MDRRQALRFLAVGGACAAWPAPAQSLAAAALRPIPTSGEGIPPIGLGTWITFDVAGDAAARQVRGDILREHFDAGARLVDSSPMYASSEEVIGAELPRAGASRVFSATKVWTMGALPGRRQIERSRKLWRVERFDLLQVHN